jgi:hypothetical protein
MKENIIGFLIDVIVILIAAILTAFPIMWLWNAVIPDIFNLPEITFIQALGLNLLCSILFRPYISNNKND